MYYLFFRSIFFRVFILFFWLSVIIGFLFLETIGSFFVSKKSINVFTFPRLFDVQYLDRFEKETGIKVYVNYYENNDELLVKLRQTKGKGYDLVIPSDYNVKQLISEGLLKMIDKKKLNFWPQLNPALLGHNFDLHNDYSIPFFWGLYGIGINKKYFAHTNVPKSWSLIFDIKNINYQIGMINNAQETFLIAALYLFGTPHKTGNQVIKQIAKLLLDQKKIVRAYTDLGAEYLLLSGSCPAALSLSSEVWQAKRYDENIEFIVPEEGTFMLIDNLAIPAGSTEIENVYKFINFLYRPSTIFHHIQHCSYFPPYVNEEIAKTPEGHAFGLLKTIPNLYFFDLGISEEDLNKLWLTLKSE